MSTGPRFATKTCRSGGIRATQETNEQGGLVVSEGGRTSTTTETIQVPVRDLRGTHSPTLGYIGLSPTLPTAEKRRLKAIHERRRQMQRLAWVRDLPVWMLQTCYQGQVPSECLLGVDGCQDAKFCLKQRLAEYARRDKA